MKKLYFLFTFLFLSNFANAQNPDAFIMTFQGNKIKIPIVFDETNNYTIDFGDGTILTNQTGPVTYTYYNTGIHTLTITGNFGRIEFGDSYLTIPNAEKIKTIEQWGTNQWKSMEGAFAYCENLIVNATDAPDLSQVTNMSNMFFSCKKFNQNINHWDVSNITNMSGLFRSAFLFNQPLDDWDVSNVIDMSSMFRGAMAFDQTLNNWDVSNVTD